MWWIWMREVSTTWLPGPGSRPETPQCASIARERHCANRCKSPAAVALNTAAWTVTAASSATHKKPAANYAVSAQFVAGPDQWLVLSYDGDDFIAAECCFADRETRQ